MRLLFALPGFHKYDRGAEVALMSVAEALAASGDEVTLMGSGEARPVSNMSMPLRENVLKNGLIFRRCAAKRHGRTPVFRQTCSVPMIHLHMTRSLPVHFLSLIGRCAGLLGKSRCRYLLLKMAIGQLLKTGLNIAHFPVMAWFAPIRIITIATGQHGIAR